MDRNVEFNKIDPSNVLCGRNSLGDILPRDSLIFQTTRFLERSKKAEWVEVWMSSGERIKLSDTTYERTEWGLPKMFNKPQ